MRASRLGVADRRGPHVDAAPPGAEIEPGADHGDRTWRFRAVMQENAMSTPMDGPIKVLLADDDELFLESLRALIDRQPELAVVAAACNGLEAIELADELAPDAAVIDLHMPLLDGISAVTRLRTTIRASA